MKHTPCVLSYITSIIFLLSIASCDCTPDNPTTNPPTPLAISGKPNLTLSSSCASLTKDGEFKLFVANTSVSTADLVKCELEIQIKYGTGNLSYTTAKNVIQQLPKKANNIYELSLFTTKNNLNKIDTPLELPLILQTSTTEGTITATLYYDGKKIDNTSISIPWEINSTDNGTGSGTESSSPLGTDSNNPGSGTANNSGSSTTNNSGSSNPKFNTPSSSSTSNNKSGSSNPKSNTPSSNPTSNNKPVTSNPKPNTTSNSPTSNNKSGSSNPKSNTPSSSPTSNNKSVASNAKTNTTSSSPTSNNKSVASNAKTNTTSSSPTSNSKSGNNNTQPAGSSNSSGPYSKTNPRPITEEMLKEANRKKQDNALLIDVLQKLKNNEQVDVNATVSSAGTSIIRPSGTALYQAVKMGNKEIVLALIERGADPNLIIDRKNWETYPTNYTPLHVAKDRQITEILLTAGADPTKVDFNGNTPLHEAYRLVGQVLAKDKIDLLIPKASAALRILNKKGQTPLHVLVCSNSGSFTIDAIKRLKPTEIDIDAKDNDGNTPLHSAIKNNSGMSVELKLVQALLDLGADRDITDKQFKKPIDLVEDFISKDRNKKELEKIKQLLQTYYPKTK